jgi:streptogramin lyase
MSLRTAPFTTLFLVALVALAALGASSAAAAPAVTGEFPVLGLTEANTKITPAGTVSEFKLKQGLKEVESATGIAKGPEGNLWVTGVIGAEGVVAKFSPSNPEATTVITEIAQIKNPSSIVAGPDGMMWIATEATVIQFPPAAADPDASKHLIPIGGLKPHDIDVAGSLLAIADAGLPRIVTLTTAGIEKSYPIPGGSQGVAATKAGVIGFSQQEKQPEQVGLLTPPNPPSLIELPGGGDPFGVTLGSDEAFWIVLFAKDGVERLTPTGAISFLGGLKKESMPRQIASGPGNTLWVTETKNEAEAVGRISGLEPPVTNTPPPPVVPQTKLGKGPKGVVKTKGKVAKVKFTFSSTTAGAGFECRLNKLTKKKKAKSSKAAKFAACKSPKTYKLKPGRYRFEVRAVAAGLTDKSPAKSSFKVVHVAPKHHR